MGPSLLLHILQVPLNLPKNPKLTTRYSEYGKRETTAGVEVAMLTVTFMMSILLNATIACAVLRYREMRTVTNCFLLNLAAADLLFALGIPAVAFTRISQEWRLGNIFCKILPYSQVSELAII